MRKWFMVIGLLLLVVPISAQSAPRNYVVSIPNSGYTFSDDKTQFTLEISVTNRGGDALSETVVELLGPNNTILNTDDDTNILQPLQQNETVRLQFPFATRDFAPGSTQIFRIEVGIDLYELAGTAIAEDNTALISVPIPENLPPATATPAETPPTTNTSDNPNPLSNLALPQIEFGADGSLIVNGTLYERNQILLAAGAVVFAVLLIWLLLTVVRLIFRRPARFPVWQPAYAMMPTMDPNSTIGRRQGWQQHAQNGTILAAATEGNLHPIKLLLSQDGLYMKQWRITALRLGQYDSYGRVGRSETLADAKVLNRLNRVLAQHDKLDNNKLSRKLRPIARRLVKQFRSKVGKRNLYLPVALDMRFDGKPNQIRIVFELYQCSQQAWHRLDRWEPTMAIVGSKLLENYTYTVHGMSGGETAREFFARLPEDVEWLLGEVVRSRGVVPQDAPQPQSFDVPDTLSGLQPVGNDYRMSV
jgi:hypothetical protein